MCMLNMPHMMHMTMDMAHDIGEGMMDTVHVTGRVVRGNSMGVEGPLGGYYTWKIFMVKFNNRTEHP